MTDHDPSKKEFDLFISYAHADDGKPDRRVTGLVNAIKANYERVTGNELKVFFDVKSIRTMDDWELRIMAGLRESKMMVAIISPTYFERPYCRKEWEYFIETELALALPGQGISPIYIIKSPGFPAGPMKKRLKEWVKNLRKRQYMDWLDFWDHGAAALEREDAQEKIDMLTGQIVDRLGRAAMLEVDHHLPKPSQYFVGRRDELRELRKEMLKGHIGAISAVHGIGGIGKSTLAFAYAWCYGFKYPGGRFLIPAAGLADLSAGMLALAPYKGVALSNEEIAQHPVESLNKVKTAFENGPPALIVIDNLDDPALLGPASRDRCLPRGNHVHVLATTRVSPEGVPRVASLSLDRLSSESGRVLLDRFRPIRGAARDDEWKAALRIVNLLGGLALEVETAGIYLRENPEVSYRQFATALEAQELSVMEDQVGPHVDPGKKWHPDTCLANLLEPTFARMAEKEPEAWRALEYAAHLPADAAPLPWLRDLLLADFPDLARSVLADKVSVLFRRLEYLRLLIPESVANPAESRLARIHRRVQDVIRRRSGPDVDASRQETINRHVETRAKGMKAHWGQPGLEWELAPLRDMIDRMIDRGEQHPGYLVDQIAVPLLHTGRMDETRRLWAKVAALLEQRFDDSSDNADYARGLSISYNKLGDLAVSEGDAKGARRYYEDDLAIAKRLADGSPGNADYARDLSVSYDRLGDLARSEGDAKGARRYYEEARDTLKRLADGSPGNADYARDLSVSYNKLGDLARSEGDAKGARRYYEEARDTRQRLADGSPGNADYARDLSVSYDRLGDLARSEGDAKGARRYYEEALAIAKRLADGSPSNADYARDLSVSYNKLGDLARSEGDAKGARRYYEEALAIAKRLADGSPGNADYARDLSVSYNKLGDLARSEGDAKGARRYYEEARDTRQRLADGSPGNADYARDLWVSFWKIATLLEQSGDDEAVDWWRRCWETFADMKRRGMHISPGDEQFLKWLEDRFGFGR